MSDAATMPVPPYFVVGNPKIGSARKFARFGYDRSEPTYTWDTLEEATKYVDPRSAKRLLDAVRERSLGGEGAAVYKVDIVIRRIT